MSKKGKRRTGECAYCGNEAELSQDHVIPECLFPHPLPSDIEMITVYACDVCNNNKKSKNDSFLRDMLVCDIWNSDNPLAQQAYQSMLRSAGYNKSDLARLMPAHGRMEPYIDSEGQFRGYGYRVQLDEAYQKRIQDTFSTMARGLYYRRWKTLFPKGYTFDVLKMEPPAYLSVLHKLEEHGLNSCHRLADGVFTWKYGYLEKDPANGYQLMSFYDTVFACIISKPPTD